jgi:HlyD family secretion protein
VNAEAAPQAAARKRKSRWALFGVIALVVIVAAAAGFALLRPKAGAQTSVSTAPVTKQTLRILVSGTGTTVVADSITVNPKISGTVKKLYVSLGKSVSAGDRLYTITSDDVETQRLQAKASLLQSKQSLAQATQNRTQASNQVYAAKTQQLQAQQNLDNLRSQPATTPGIDDQIAVGKRQLTSAKKGVTSANQSLTAAQAGVDAAEANYTSSRQSYNDAVDATRDTVVTAPIDGVVTVLPISVGSDVNAGSTSSASGSSGGTASGGGASASGASSSSSSGSSGSSITISDMGTLDVEVAVSEADISSVSVDQSATITFDAIKDTTFKGKVKSISPNGTSTSGVVSYTVTLSFAPQDERLKPDMTATADIETQVAENVLTVPSVAVKTKDGEKYVVVVGPDGTTAEKAVTTGVSDDTNTEIKTGVTEGEAVATGSVASGSTGSSSSGRRGLSIIPPMPGGGGRPGGPGDN